MIHYPVSVFRSPFLRIPSPASFPPVSVFIDRQNLRKIVTRTEELIHRKIRTLVVDENEFAALKGNLDIEHALPVWDAEKGDRKRETGNPKNE